MSMAATVKTVGARVGGSGFVRRAQYVAVAGLTFQVIHLIEHFAQTGYWFMHPSDAPWLTPWAVLGRNMLVVGGKVATGNELLHLIGNGIFMAGLVGMVLVVRGYGRATSEFPHLSKAIASQGVHLAEHVALTVTTFASGKAIGISTMFGLASGAWGSSYRVWFHFILNFIATYYAAMAMAEMHQDDLVVPGARPLPTRVLTARR
jgi:hypothetical protein